MTVKTGLTQVGTDHRGEDSPKASGILTAVVDALYDLHRHRDASTLAEKILAVVPRMVACDSALWVRVDPAMRSFTFAGWPADRFAAIDHKEAASLHLQDHPLVAHFGTRRDARAWSPHDFVPRAAFQRTLLYRKLYRPLGIEFQLVLLVPYPDRAPRVLALHRRSTPFSESDRDLLELLWPHLTQAVRASRAAARKRGLPEIDGLSAGRGVVLLDRTGKVELCTEQARIWLTRYCTEGFSRREIRSLPEPIAGWVAEGLGDRSLQSRGIADPHPPLILRRGDQYLAMRLVATMAGASTWC